MTDARMAIGLAALYRKNGDYQQALELVEETLTSDPNDPVILLEKARSLFQLGEAREARTVWDRVMAIWENATEDYQYYRDALELGDKLKEAG